MSKGRDAVAALLDDAKRRQKEAARQVGVAQRTLAKRQKVLTVIDAEVAELTADIAKLDKQLHLKLVS